MFLMQHFWIIYRLCLLVFQMFVSRKIRLEELNRLGSAEQQTFLQQLLNVGIEPVAYCIKKHTVNFYPIKRELTCELNQHYYSQE